MRGRFCTQPFLVEKQARYPLSPQRFPSPAPLSESIAPSSAPVCALGHLPPRGRLWGWVLSFRVSTVPPIYPAGHASQSFPARRRGKKIQSCFDRLRRPKHTSHPESAGSAGAVRGASPNFGSPAQRVPKFLPFPARPAGGRAVTGVRYRAAGQAEKKRGPSQGPPKLEKVGPGRKNLFFPGALSSGFLRRKPGPRPGPGGNPRGRVHPAMALTGPPTETITGSQIP